jgi:hypothetical protein
VLFALVALVAACGTEGEAPALCEAVTALTAAHGDLSTTVQSDPDAEQIAQSYRELADHYDGIASLLVDGDAAESTRDLATLYEDAARALGEHSPNGAESIAHAFEASEELEALRQRMTGAGPLGFTRPAWDEIDGACEIAVDPSAPG